MGRRRSGPRGGSDGPDPSELEGFLTGVRHRLAARRAEGEPLPALESEVDRAARAFGAGDLPRAETALLAIADQLDALEPDPELREHPRGLVRYDADDRGVPTPEEDDAVRNRLLLAARLVAVAASEGLDVSSVVARLRRAHDALEEGDRARAVVLGDGALDEIDRMRRGRPDRSRS
jgi:hypothetical protein